MTSSTYKPFGSVTTGGTVDFSVNSGFTFNGGTSQNKTFYKGENPKSQEDVKEIFKSAVGDFTERPLQIMIREIAKNLLIFTPIGWIILLVLICRTYKGQLKDAGGTLKEAFMEAIDSLGLLKK